MCSITAYIAVEDDRNLRDIWAAHVYAIRMGNLQLEQLAFGSLPNAILDALKAEGHVFEHGSGIGKLHLKAIETVILMNT